MTPKSDHTWGHTTPFCDEYFENVRNLLETTVVEIPVWTAVADRAVHTIQSGYNVHANITTGHMPTAELSNDREGNPAPFIFQGPDHHTPEQYAAMRSGDLLLTNCVTPAVREVRDRGVYVCVFTTPYVESGTAPSGEVVENPEGLLPEGVANEVIQTHIPWEQGLVHVPEVPEMKLFPASSNVSCSIHWCLTAEVMQSLGTNSSPDGSKAREYLEVLITRLEKMNDQNQPLIMDEAVGLAKNVINGGHIDVNGSNEGVRSETHSVAQGLMLTCAHSLRSLDEGGNKDALIITSVSADHPQELAWARQAKDNGNRLIAVGMEPSTELQRLSDCYLSNACHEEDGVVEVAGCEESICPTSGIINNVITQMLLAQMTDELCRRGAVPYFYMGVYRTGGSEYNGLFRRHFEARGY